MGRAQDMFMEREAVISDCGKYRYLLRRVWDHDKPRALFVMLNPSTADASIDDPTIRSCIRLSRGLGYGSFEVVNLFAWRATDPKDLEASPARVGPEQDGITEAAISRCDIPILAWGAHPIARERGAATEAEWRSIKDRMIALVPALCDAIRDLLGAVAERDERIAGMVEEIAGWCEIAGDVQKAIGAEELPPGSKRTPMPASSVPPMNFGQAIMKFKRQRDAEKDRATAAESALAERDKLLAEADALTDAMQYAMEDALEKQYRDNPDWEEAKDVIENIDLVSLWLAAIRARQEAKPHE